MHRHIRWAVSFFPEIHSWLVSYRPRTEYCTLNYTYKSDLQRQNHKCRSWVSEVTRSMQTRDTNFSWRNYWLYAESMVVLLSAQVRGVSVKLRIDKAEQNTFLPYQWSPLLGCLGSSGGVSSSICTPMERFHPQGVEEICKSCLLALHTTQGQNFKYKRILLTFIMTSK